MIEAIVSAALQANRGFGRTADVRDCRTVTRAELVDIANADLTGATAPN